MQKNNKTFFDDFQVSSQRNLGKKKDNGLRMSMPIGAVKTAGLFLPQVGLRR